MLGNVGETRTPPRVSSRDISEAFDLLKVVNGGDKKGLALLEKMFAAQQHNETILNDARILKKSADEAAIRANALTETAAQTQAQAQAMQATLATDTEAANTVIQERRSSVDAREKSLANDVAAHNNKVTGLKSAVAEHKEKVDTQSVALDKREAACNELTQRLRKVLSEFVRIGELAGKAGDRARQIL